MQTKKPFRPVTRPLLLDLFCGAGGAGEGYRRAGFDVIGIDIDEHDYRPGHFIRGDALSALRDLLTWDRTPDLIHASPPCQRYSVATGIDKQKRHPDLVGPVRDLLLATGIPYVIENVPRAPLRSPAILCGSSFDLAVRRHRAFETHGFTLDSTGCDHAAQGIPVGVYGQHPDRRGYMRPGGTRRAVKAVSDAHACAAMGIDWPMPWREVVDAIPPAYSEYVGRAFLAQWSDEWRNAQ